MVASRLCCSASAAAQRASDCRSSARRSTSRPHQPWYRLPACLPHTLHCLGKQIRSILALETLSLEGI